MSELKPCPFCGDEAVRMDFLDNPPFKEMKGTRYFGCRNCCVVSFVYTTEAEAIEAWNTRAERTCHVEVSYYDDLMDEDYTDLSCGHHLRAAPREFDFCPKCGARVKEDTDAD